MIKYKTSVKSCGASELGIGVGYHLLSDIKVWNFYIESNTHFITEETEARKIKYLVLTPQPGRKC